MSVPGEMGLEATEGFLGLQQAGGGRAERVLDDELARDARFLMSISVG